MTDELGGAAEARAHALEFRGSGGEYFRIWIVNLFLTLVTLGIYSAWAKVRTQRYFASSTLLHGASFAYLASPIAILKGRLLVLGFLLLYAGSSFVLPVLDGVFGLAFFFLVPWAITRSLSFRAHNTSWRNVRFALGARYGEAFSAYVGLPLLSVFSLGLLYPYAIFQQRRFIVGNAAFGTTRFAFAARSGDFFRLFFRLGLMLIGVALAIGALLVTSGQSGAVVLGIAALPVYFYAFAFMTSGITNLTYDGARLGPHRLVSRLPTAGLALLYGTNALAMLASLGLLIPWARVRVARYRFEHLVVIAGGSLEDFVATQGGDVASLGAEFGQAFDLDLGL